MLEALPITKYINTHPMRRESLGSSDTVSENTMLLMAKIIKESSENPYVRRWAEYIIEKIPRDPYQRISAIFQYLQNHTQYEHDISSIELIRTPPVSLQLMEVGDTPVLDCDDYVVLSLSLLKSLGYKVAMRAAGYKTSELTHVYGLVNIGNSWVPYDLTQSWGMKYEPPGAVSMKTMEV